MIEGRKIKEANLMQHMPYPGYDLQLKLALHVPYHQFAIQPLCTSKHQETRGFA